MRTIVLIILTASLATGATSEPVDEESVFHDEITVERVIAEVRVIDRRGRPVLGLDASDFSIELGGIATPPESVEWVTTLPPDEPTPAAAPADDGGGQSARHEGRLIVLLVQTSLDSVHLSGLFRMSEYAGEMLERLGPQDRVALAVYSSHLDLISDFTADHTRLGDLLEVPNLLEHRPEVIQADEPSLVSEFDFDAAHRAAKPSRALEIIGEALQHIPGTKTVVMMGWGLGTYTSHGVVLGPPFARAVDALTQAQTSVFVLDVTDADFHSLEAGLKSVAVNTGGRYERTHKHPGVAVDLILRALEGYYEIVLTPPAEMLSERVHLKVEVDRRGAEVLAPPYLIINR